MPPDRSLLIEWPTAVRYTNDKNRAHWNQTSRHQAELRSFFCGAARRAAAGEGFPWPQVTVEFLLIVERKRRLPDTDAIAVAAKAALDGLVDGGVVIDDTADHVRSVTFHAPESGDRDGFVCLVKQTEPEFCKVSDPSRREKARS